MDENSFIYGTRTTDSEDKVLVKMYVPRHLKTRLDTLKLISGRKLQEIGAEALEEYLNRELAHWTAKRETIVAQV